MFEHDRNAGRPPEGGASASAEGERPRDTRAAFARPAAELLDMQRNAELVDQAIQDRAAEFRAQYQPRNGVEDWLVHDMARHSLDIDVQKARLVRDTARLIDQAQTSWDDVRKAEALDLMARLPRSPGPVAAKLEKTRHGVDALLDCYYHLRTIIAQKGAIDDHQRGVLFSLLGVALDQREGSTRVPAADDGAKLAELVAHQIQRLETKRETVLIAEDQRARNRAIHGVILTPDAVTRQLRRELAAATRGLQASYKLLMEGRKAAAAAPAPASARVAAGCAADSEARRVHPPQASRPAGPRPTRPAVQAAAASGSPASAPPAGADDVLGPGWDRKSGPAAAGLLHSFHVGLAEHYQAAEQKLQNEAMREAARASNG